MWSWKGVEERHSVKSFVIIEIKKLKKKNIKSKQCEKEKECQNLILFFRDFYKMLENLCKKWILQKILRARENFIWKHFENFRAILDKL